MTQLLNEMNKRTNQTGKLIAAHETYMAGSPSYAGVMFMNLEKPRQAREEAEEVLICTMGKTQTRNESSLGHRPKVAHCR